MFSTKLVPLSDRVHAWEWNARQFCGDCRFSFPNRRNFHGSIESKKLGDLELSLFSSTSLSFSKFPVKGTQAGEKFCTIITQLEGARSYTQNQRVIVLKAGDSTVIDSSLPWSSECMGNCVRLYLRTPRWLLEERGHNKVIPSASRIDGLTVLGRALFQLANSLYREADRLTLDEGAALAQAYFDILSGCLNQRSRWAPHSSNELCARIANFIERHLQEPTLSPVVIAAGMGISARHLHRVFAHTGQTVGDWIRQRRLEQCRTDLADTRLRDHSVTDIAFSWGFCESAHFSRTFKKRFGVSPREFRSRACELPWNESEENLERLLAAGSSNSQPN